jgi:hypothetical protein
VLWIATNFLAYFHARLVFTSQTVCYSLQGTGMVIRVTYIRMCSWKQSMHLYGLRPWLSYLNAGLPAVSPCASERSCDRATRSMIAVVFLSPRENADLASKLHVALISSLTVLASYPKSFPSTLRMYSQFSPHNTEFKIQLKCWNFTCGACLKRPLLSTLDSLFPNVPACL